MGEAKIGGLEDPESVARARAGFARLERSMRWNEQDATQKDGRLHYTPDQALGRELRNRLHVVYRRRIAGGLAVGNLDGWAGAVCRVAARCDSEVSSETVSKHCVFIGIEIPTGILTPVVDGAAAAFAAGALRHSAALLGEMIQLTSAEREECGINRLIDACDEPRGERTRRLARERQRRRRAFGKDQKRQAKLDCESSRSESRSPISHYKE